MNTKMNIFVLISVFISLCFITPALALTAEKTEQEALTDDLLAKIKSKLSLSDEELEKLKPVITEEADELLALTEKVGSKGILGIFSMKKELKEAQNLLLDRLEEEVPEAGKLRDAVEFYDDFKESLQDEIYDRIVVELAGQLGFTEEQLSQVSPILKDDLNKRGEIFDKYEGQRIRKFRAFQKENTALVKETTANLKGILTEEQLEEFGSVHKKILGGLKDMIFKREKDDEDGEKE